MEQAFNSVRIGCRRYIEVGKQSILSRMASTPGSSLLESVPAEIKLKIFRYITDYQTLRSLVHASAIYRSTYIFARAELLTKATILKLKDRGIDVLTPADFAEVCVHGGKRLSRYLQPALQKLYSQIIAGVPTRLSATHCKALLTLVELKGFSPDHSLWGSNHYNHGFRCVTTDDDVQYLNLYGWRRYRILAFGNQNAASRVAIKRQLNGAHHMAGVIKYQREKLAAKEKRNAKRNKLLVLGKALVRAKSQECVVL